jgi:HK97 gp10 family phage protein
VAEIVAGLTPYCEAISAIVSSRASTGVRMARHSRSLSFFGRPPLRHNVDANGREAAVGTDIDYAKYLEFGTSKMPARPFLGGALVAKEHEIGDGVLAEVKKIFEK